MSVMLEYSSELVKRAAAEIIAARPAYRDLIEFYAEIFAAQEEARPRVRLEPFLLSPELVRVKRQDRFPLIQVEEMRFDPAAGEDLFEALCRIAVDRQSKLSGPAEILRPHSTDTARLFEGFLGGDEVRIKQAAAALGVEAGALSFFLYHSLRPSICCCEQDLSGFLTDELSWERGYCPICGSAPALARLEADGQRFLFCSFCWHRWPARRTVCPFCDNSDPGRLSYLYSDEEKEYRLDLCAGCRRYVKTIDSRQLARPLYPPLEQVATLHLDLKAAESGYESALPAQTALPPDAA
jgi:FdhE protein